MTSASSELAAAPPIARQSQKCGPCRPTRRLRQRSTAAYAATAHPAPVIAAARGGSERRAAAGSEGASPGEDPPYPHLEAVMTEVVLAGHLSLIHI